MSASKNLGKRRDRPFDEVDLTAESGSGSESESDASAYEELEGLLSGDQVGSDTPLSSDGSSRKNGVRGSSGEKSTVLRHETSASPRVAARKGASNRSGSASRNPVAGGKPRSGGAKHRVWTLNNPTAEEKRDLAIVAKDPGSYGLVHILWCEEIGASGTPHLQGMLSAKKQLRNLKKIPGLERSWSEQRKGTVKQAVEYCSKSGGTVMEGGTRPRDPGEKSSAAEEFVKDIKGGRTLMQMLERDPAYVIRNIKAVGLLKQEVEKNKTRLPVEVYWYWGATGAGKSFSAMEEAKSTGGDIYRHNNTKWWDGYTGQPNVIIDDFELTSEFRFVQLLKVLDQYPLLVETKGGGAWLHATKIWVTSSFDPETIDQGGQLMRRITKVVCKKKEERPDIVSMFAKQKAEVNKKKNVNESEHLRSYCAHYIELSEDCEECAKLELSSVRFVS